MSTLIELLERINELPLTPEERADLMRGVIAEAKRTGGALAFARGRPGPKPAGGVSTAQVVLDALADGQWRTVTMLTTATGRPVGGVNTALRDLALRGKLVRERRTEAGVTRWWYARPPEA